MSLAGIAAGTLMALAGMRFVRSMLYGVKPENGWMLAGAAAGVVVVALAASLIPARRAASIDPMAALRCE